MRRLALGVVAALSAAVVAVSAVGGIAFAKWSTSRARPPAEIAQEPASAQLSAFDANGRNQVIDSISFQDQVLSLPFGPIEASEIQIASQANSSNGGTVYWAKPFALSAIAHGTMGLGYEVSLPDLSGSAYGANLLIFGIDKTDDCTSTAVAQKWGELPGQGAPVDHDLDEAISAEYAADKTFEELWCVAAVFTPQTIENRVDVEGFSPSGTKADAWDSWHAYRFPVAENEPSISFDFTINFFGPK
ncbi:MAG: hypothetical protein LBU05_06760 [Bifidobacteriaceae bacterium]|jgi:hypothetical protein|nr:hypothetical protein [Bifidobacteriaceae bacterium]